MSNKSSIDTLREVVKEVVEEVVQENMRYLIEAVDKKLEEAVERMSKPSLNESTRPKKNPFLDVVESFTDDQPKREPKNKSIPKSRPTKGNNSLASVLSSTQPFKPHEK